MWNDLVDADSTELDVDGLIEDSFPVISQKTWNAQTPTRTYAEFTAGIRGIGRGPGLTSIGAVSQPGTVERSRNASVTASSSTPEGPAAALTDGSRTVVRDDHVRAVFADGAVRHRGLGDGGHG